MERGARHSFPTACKLMYAWHGKTYLGGAHGLCGIVYALLPLQPLAGERAALAREVLDFLPTLRLPSGNYPSREGSRDDRLVQFCHGATGPALLLARAALMLRDAELLERAGEAAAVVWERGLLTKGPGLCHGVAGGILAFLKLYRASRDGRWLLRALCFLQFLVEEKPVEEKAARASFWQAPDQPSCLYNGAAGLFWAVHEILLVLQDQNHDPCWPGLDLLL